MSISFHPPRLLLLHQILSLSHDLRPVVINMEMKELTHNSSNGILLLHPSILLHHPQFHSSSFNFCLLRSIIDQKLCCVPDNFTEAHQPRSLLSRRGNIYHPPLASYTHATTILPHHHLLNYASGAPAGACQKNWYALLVRFFTTTMARAADYGFLPYPPFFFMLPVVTLLAFDLSRWSLHCNTFCYPD